MLLLQTIKLTGNMVSADTAGDGILTLEAGCTGTVISKNR